METDRNSKTQGPAPAGTVKAKAQGMVAEGPSAMPRLASLYDVALQIERASTRDEILAIVRSEAKWLLKYDVCLLGLANRTASHYVITTLSSIADAAELNHKHFSMDEGMIGWVVRNQASMIEATGSGPSFSHVIEGKLQEFGIASLLIVPMRSGGETIGALLFGATQASAYKEDDTVIAQLFAHQVGTALKHASIFDDARKRITQIELINEVSSQLTGTLNLEALLELAAATIQRTFHYFDVTIFLLTEDGEELSLEAHAGSFVDFLPHGYRQKVSDGFIGWAVRNGEKVLSNDVSQDRRYVAYAYHNTKSELSLPITVDGKVIGVLNVEDTKLHAFDDTDAVVLGTLCDQLGAAIKNARLYDEVNRAYMKMTELDKMKSEFLGIVSHDFRSPLSSIMLAGRSLLKNEALTQVPRGKEYLQLIVEQAIRLNQLAEDTLSITKMESGQLTYYFKIVNIERLIQDAVSMVKFSSRHQFEYTVEPDAMFMKGDQAKLRQVLQNLVSNAVKYSPKGGKVTITVTDHSADLIMVSVADQGIGIPPEKVGKLFQKFSRVDAGEAKEIKGAGLGLWICREIVEAHGGKIWIESEPGKGTTMKLIMKKAQQ
jgi:K+-sensing histidine kinase KdpD